MNFATENITHIKNYVVNVGTNIYERHLIPTQVCGSHCKITISLASIILIYKSCSYLLDGK